MVELDCCHKDRTIMENGQSFITISHLGYHFFRNIRCIVFVSSGCMVGIVRVTDIKHITDISTNFTECAAFVVTLPRTYANGNHALLHEAAIVVFALYVLLFNVNKLHLQRKIRLQPWHAHGLTHIKTLKTCLPLIVVSVGWW